MADCWKRLLSAMKTKILSQTLNCHFFHSMTLTMSMKELRVIPEIQVMTMKVTENKEPPALLPCVSVLT